jgi:hypothetical protein
VLDWVAVAELAQRHQLVPLLFHHLAGLPAGTVPGGTLDLMRAGHAVAVADGLRLTGELRSIVALLEGGGVPCIPFKGPLLALEVYGDPALRSFADLDVMVRRSDARRAAELLAGRGYRFYDDLTPRQAAELLRRGADWMLYREADDVTVELHWRFHPLSFACALEPDELWARTRTVCLGTTEVRTLARDDLLLVLCVHGTRHRWERLEWLCGVAELLRLGGFDWSHVMARAERLHVTRMLSLGVLLARGLLDAPVPAAVLRALPSRTVVAELARQVERRLFEPEPATESASHRMARLGFELRAKDRLSDRLRYLYRSLVWQTHAEWRDLPLDDRFFPLYLVLRPLRLAFRHGAARRLLRRRAGDTGYRADGGEQ